MLMSGDCEKKNLRHAPYRFAVRPCYRRLLAAKVHWTICLSLHDLSGQMVALTQVLFSTITFRLKNFELSKIFS